jgi:hypothetical protein
MKNEISTRLQDNRFGESYFICVDLEGCEPWQVDLLVGHLEEFGHEHVEGFKRKLSPFQYEKSRGCFLACTEIDHHRAKINHLTQYINHLKNKSYE